MPLAFQSLSHGQLVFGFFNVASDMLLIERFFFFNTVFCRAIEEAAAHPDGQPFSVPLDAFEIADPQARGDLMGAIHGQRFEGFIGETYLRWPFPAKPEDFKQQPGGERNQAEVASMIEKWARPLSIELAAPASCSDDSGSISIADYRFDRPGFQALLDYVWQGGMPTWQDGARPSCVMAMQKAAAASDHWAFAGLRLD